MGSWGMSTIRKLWIYSAHVVIRFGYFCVITRSYHALFCFSPPLSPGTVLTVQSMSEDDHKFWMQAMGGKEPVSQLTLPSLPSHHLSHSLLACPGKTRLYAVYVFM